MMPQRYRHSLAVRRAGVALLAVIVMLNVGAITFWRFDELDAVSHATVIAAFWGLGIVALLLLARGWRWR
jgi:hypothetical protein